MLKPPEADSCHNMGNIILCLMTDYTVLLLSIVILNKGILLGQSAFFRFSFKLLTVSIRHLRSVINTGCISKRYILTYLGIPGFLEESICFGLYCEGNEIKWTIWHLLALDPEQLFFLNIFPQNIPSKI